MRVFSGHNDHISAIECAPDGKIFASADCAGNIFFWDIAKGTKIKRSRGHGKGGIWSLSFSVESNVLASGGQDGTVRLWDVVLPADPQKVAQQVGLNAEGLATDGAAAATGDAARPAGAAASQPAAATTTGGTKKKSKEVMITPDQISAFVTKKTPVMKVKFTRMNLVMVGGCFDLER